MIWTTLILLLLLSATCSALETTLFGLSRQARQVFANSTHRSERLVHQVLQHPQRVLLTILFANTTVNVAIFAISYVALDPLQGAHPVVATAGRISVLLGLILFGEIIPKAVALLSARSLAPMAAAIVTLLEIGLGPVLRVLGVVLVNPITRLFAPARPSASIVSTDELRMMVEHSAREGIIHSKEGEMLQSVVALGESSVRELMTPRVDIQFIRTTDDRPSIRLTIQTSRRRRLLVCGRDLDHVVGMMNVRDFHLNPETPVRSLIRPIHFIPEQINLLQLIGYFRSENVQFAVVVDEYGGTAGLVSMEDVVERMVGDLPDYEPARPATASERIDEDTYRVSGDLSVHVWSERFGIREIDRRIDTVAGLVLARLGRMPRVGDRVRVRNLVLTVEEVKKRRIQQVRLHRVGDGKPDMETVT